MPIEAYTRRFLLLGAAGAWSATLGQDLSSGSRVRGRFDLERFIEDVRRASAGGDAQAAVEELLQRAVDRPRAVMSDLGEPAEAGIHTIYRGHDVTILNVVWAPLMVLLPHNHNIWASIGIYTGREDNILWERESGRITALGAASLSEGQVFGLPPDAIHSVTNPIGRLTGAIHIYGGDFFAPGRSEWDADTLRERPFDLDSAREDFRKAAERYEAVP
ncbi:MAG TPA: hypothetical protein VMR74_03335 [Gammaproteobacteria bacterium]|nr:hypothetical protein [Gammaproteobacteria bacterium]